MGIKRSLYFLEATLVLLFFSFAAQGEGRPFITRWKGEAGKELKIPIGGTNFKLVIKRAADATVLKTESSLTIARPLTEPYRYTSVEDGELIIEAGPEGVTSFKMAEDAMVSGWGGSWNNLLLVERFGTVRWERLDYAFSRCKYMQFASDIDTPDLSRVTDLSFMFDGCRLFNSDISNWDVSKVTDMRGMFDGCFSFNYNLGSWKLEKCRWLDLEEGMSRENYSKSLEGWAAQTNIKEGLRLEVSRLPYNKAGKIARDKLVNEKHWNISGDKYINSDYYYLAFLPTEHTVKKDEVLLLRLFVEGFDANESVILTSSDPLTVQVLDQATLSIKGLKAGKSIITATIAANAKHGTMTATCEIEVIIPVKEIKLSHESVIMGKKSRLALSATVLPEDATNKQVYWTSTKKEVARVVFWYGDETPWLTSENEVGTTTITAIADDGSVKAECNVTVIENFKSAKGVSLSQTKLSLGKGGTATLTATVQPEDATNQRVLWSTNNELVATVENGMVTAVSEGDATITVTTEDGNYTATCKVTVTIPVTGVSLSQTELSLSKGGTATLTATVAPSDATNQNVTWSSNNTEVATVNNGTVTAVSGGKATITVTTEDGGHTATCNVTVTVPVTGISLSQTELSLEKGKTATLTATVAPSDATNQNVSWRSNNTAVATVENGTVTAISEGNATITVTTEDGGHTATCSVKVKSNSTNPVHVTGVKLSLATLPLKLGTSHTLVASVEPANATNKAVTWSSSNEAVASVSDKGVVEAKTVGTATITVTTKDGGHTATCEVSVTAEDIVLTGITISPSETTLEVDKETTLSLTFVPITATHKGVKWSSNDPTIATVDEHGKVKGIAAGETTITAVSEKYESVTNTCKVTVIPPTAVVDAVFASVVISPNPFGAQLRIANGDLRGQYVLYNVQGVEVASGVLEGTETRINTIAFAAGTYLLRLTAENGATKTLTVVKD